MPTSRTVVVEGEATPAPRRRSTRVAAIS